MMTVDIKINGELIHQITVINRGLIDDAFIDGDEPGGGGPRRYDWHAKPDGTNGTFTHYRSDGALVLAIAACIEASCDNLTPPTHPEGIHTT